MTLEAASTETTYLNSPYYISPSTQQACRWGGVVVSILSASSFAGGVIALYAESYWVGVPLIIAGGVGGCLGVRLIVRRGE